MISTILTSRESNLMKIALFIGYYSLGGNILTCREIPSGYYPVTDDDEDWDLGLPAVGIKACSEDDQCDPSSDESFECG